jgi:aerobic-type carbon monoxide dehydrogenase small subunit (CoxS/CutS family)
MREALLTVPGDSNFEGGNSKVEMLEEKEKEEAKGLSRREFLKDAGLVVGGAAVGSTAFLNACSSTKTVTTTKTGTATTVTVTSTGAAVYTDPVDGTTYSTLAALQAHFNATHPNGDSLITAFNVNGTDYAFQVKPYWSLAHVLREGLGLFGTRLGCSYGECGICTVIVDGIPIFSCMMLACEMEGKKVTTVEGLSNAGVLNPIQQKFYDNEASQCGICTPGFLMAAQALINNNPKPSMDDVRQAFSGHLCMCGSLHRHINATVGGV